MVPYLSPIPGPSTLLSHTQDLLCAGRDLLCAGMTQGAGSDSRWNTRFLPFWACCAGKETPALGGMGAEGQTHWGCPPAGVARWPETSAYFSYSLSPSVCGVEMPWV